MKPVRASQLGRGPGMIVQGQLAGILVNCPDGRCVQYVPKRLGPLPNGQCEGDFASQRPGDALLEDDSAVQAAVTKYLKGGKRLGRGVTSVVYADAKKKGLVWKLTVDRPSYEILKELSKRGNKHTPKVLQDYGHVGNQEDGLALYLLGIERLYPLPKGEIRAGSGSEADLIDRELSRWRGESASEKARMVGKVAREEWDDNELADYFYALATELENFDQSDGRVAIDLHTCNMMKRASGDVIVMSDPVVQINLIDRARNNRRAGLGQEVFESSDSSARSAAPSTASAARMRKERIAFAKNRAKEQAAKEKRKKAWARQEAARAKKGTMARKAFGLPLRPPHARTFAEAEGPLRPPGRDVGSDVGRMGAGVEGYTARIWREAKLLRQQAARDVGRPDFRGTKTLRGQARVQEEELAARHGQAEGLMSPSHERWEVSRKIPRLPGMTKLTHERREVAA